MKEETKKSGFLTAGLIILFMGMTVLKNDPEKLLDRFNPPASDVLNFPGEVHFKNIRQLTFSGENAEAYFSPDGRKLVFQAHDGDELCDQIYIMDIESGKTKLVSTGDGVTTCSYFQYPHNDKIIYSSTHHYTRSCPPPPDFSKGYVWKLHPEFDIFRSNPGGMEIEQLTDTWGYDAEATCAESGSKIVYTSLSSGDLEVWTMNRDGSDKRQLTNRLGYDGGAFFSHDGTKIVWRAFYPETGQEIVYYKQLLMENTIRPMSLQIYVMDSNGKNKIKITNNEGTSFAPYFFTDDNRVIFSSNMKDPKGRNFDLWAVDIDGNNLEQITTFSGFDGFPVFSPDGNRLVFSSNRNQEKPHDTNIFICEWRD